MFLLVVAGFSTLSLSLSHFWLVLELLALFVCSLLCLQVVPVAVAGLLAFGPCDVLIVSYLVSLFLVLSLFVLHFLVFWVCGRICAILLVIIGLFFGDTAGGPCCFGFFVMVIEAVAALASPLFQYFV